MAHFIVKEKVWLVYYVEADTAAAALDHVKGLGVSEYDEVDTSVDFEYIVEENA